MQPFRAAPRVGDMKSIHGMAVVTAAVISTMVSISPAGASGITQVGQLRNAPIPASCRHQATTLDGFSKDFGTAGRARLLKRKAAFGHLDGVAGKIAAVPMVCDAGGVTWPEYVLLYGSGHRLLGHVDLGRIANAQEHEDVTAVRFAHGRVKVRWRGYDGAGFTASTYRGEIGWSQGHRTWSHNGPLTVNYAQGRTSYDEGPGIVTTSGGANVWLRPAPNAFRQFIQHRWRVLTRAGSGCEAAQAVVVDRFSHMGFAAGAEGSCGGARYIWARVHGKWRALIGYQDGPYCYSMTHRVHNALVALGLSCYTKADHVRHFGHWPTSGQ